MNTQWDTLMDECIDIREYQDAKSFFKAVESLAKVLNLTCDTGKEFDAAEAHGQRGGEVLLPAYVQPAPGGK